MLSLHVVIRLRRAFALLFLVSSALSASGCSSSSSATSSPSHARPSGTYVGTLDGTDASVAWVFGGGEAIAFFCGGPSSLDSSTRWFRGASTDAHVALAAGAAKAAADVNGDTLSGTLDRGDGTVAAFSAHHVDDAAAEGLYEGNDDQGHAGVIVKGNDAMQGAFIVGATSAVLQIVPVRPGPLDIQNGTLAVKVGDRTINVLRVLLR